jgi:hypothetical protein
MIRHVSNLPSTPTLPRATPATPVTRARKRRAKRGIVANYIHEISPRHRAGAAVVPAAIAPVAMTVAEPLDA